MNDRKLLLALSIVAFGMAVAVALGPLQGLAHVSDEVAYTLQAKLFVAGMRTAPPADQPSMMLFPFWQTAPRSYAVFPPGWPALLAVGVAVGLPWLVNPLLAAALPPLTWLLARAWQRDEDEARLAATVAALSPGIVLLAGSRMPHTSVLVALLGALVVVERRTDGARAWLAAALGLAYVVLARQLDALVLAGPLWAWGAWRLRDRRALLAGWAALPAMALGLLLLDNQHLTGHALSFPVSAWYDQWVADQHRPPGCNALGFGPIHGCAPVFGSWGHTPAKAASIADHSLVMLDRLLLGIPGGLLVALVGAVRVRRWRVPLWFTVAILGGYALYWSPGQAYGARFHHPLYVSRLLQQEGVHDGVVFLQGAGTREESWPWLGTEQLTCDPLLASGAAFQLDDPTGKGLQVRHALPSPDVDRLYMRRYHPGQPAWLVVHDLATDRYHLESLQP